ncbi:MAG: FKBP-type peptidyl-prolyl cis-trans isomerase [Bacteroidales bacterium]|nr:FKBP-type peptidyl-prolyl cis-trans isomerase [Bacteroidales bacterium]
MRSICYILSLFLLLISCSNEKNKNQEQMNYIDKQQIKDVLEDFNRQLLIQEAKMIDDYVDKQDLDFVKTGTGLRYAIISQNEGELIKTGDMVTIEYEISSLNGDVYYSSKNEGNKSFIVGRGGVESGVEEAIIKLHVNDTAILIIPSHLAHGLVGDGKKIPAKSTLLYKLKVIENKINN